MDKGGFAARLAWHSYSWDITPDWVNHAQGSNVPCGVGKVWVSNQAGENKGESGILKKGGYNT